MKTSLPEKKWIVVLISLFLILVPEATLLAWNEHPLISYPVVSVMSELRDAKPVHVESLDAFVMAEEKRLSRFLSEEETWARNNLPWYAPRPESLAFKATGNPNDIHLRFCQAIRVNPKVKFPLYLQFLPGIEAGRSPNLTAKDITFLQDTSDWGSTTFVGLKAGEMVQALDVVVSATDEPDLLGLDIGLFEDNGTDFGKVYGFGVLPFGNPHLEYGSQAPFHMGFYHEAKIIYFLAGFLKKTYPEYRIHLYKKLSEFAFQSGHPYWGWRFMGWGLHYLADLTQPYHATALPGVSTSRSLWINMEDLFGVHGPKADAMQLVSNRHTAVEKYLQVVLQKAYRDKDQSNPILLSLRSIKERLPYEDTVPRQVIAQQAHARSAETDAVLVENMPKKFILDPHFELGTSEEREQIVLKIQAEKGQAAIDRLNSLIVDLLEPFVTYGPSFIRATLSEAKGLRQ